MPHSTQVAGYAAIHGGDDRWIGNIFLAGDPEGAYARDWQSAPGAPRTGTRAGYGTAGYDGHPSSFAEYLALVGDPSRGDLERFVAVTQPVYIRDNVYAEGATPYEGEQGAASLGDASVHVAVVADADDVHLEARLPPVFDQTRLPVLTGRDLERVRFVDGEFEEPDGSPAVLDTDLIGARKTEGLDYPAGPLARLTSGASRIHIW